MRGVLAAFLLISVASSRAEDADQPYIDYLKEQHEGGATAPTGTPFIEGIKRNLGEGEAPESSEGYADFLRRKAEPVDGSYTETIRKGLKPEDEKSAIEAVHQGTSDLEFRKEGSITAAAGMRLGTSVSPRITAAAGAGGQSLENVYGSGWIPDVSFFYEFQPWHSEWFGNLGVILTLGITARKGTGVFQFNLAQPWNPSESFGASSQTKFQFFSVPATAGIIYRFNLLRILRPYVTAAPGLTGYVETRNDSREGNRGTSRTLHYGAGIALLLDWIDRGMARNLYAESGIHHYYLTLEYSRVSTLSGDVDFDLSGLYAGLAFEF